MILMNIGDKLKQLRIESGLTQEQVAKYIESTKSCVSMYESGKRVPGRNTLPLLAELFGVSVDYILGTGKFVFNESAAEYKVLPNIPTYESINDMVLQKNSFCAKGDTLLACLTVDESFYLAYHTPMGKAWILVGSYNGEDVCKVVVEKDSEILIIDSSNLSEYDGYNLLGRAYNLTYIL